MQKNVVIAAVVGVVVVAVAVFYLFGSDIKKTITPKPKTTPVPTSTTGDRHSPVSDITVNASEFSFSPSTIVVRAGENLTITLKNTGKMPHDLSISDLKVKTKVLQPGQSETITVKPAKAGMYEIICTVPGHAAKGMRGLLMVQ